MTTHAEYDGGELDDEPETYYDTTDGITKYVGDGSSVNLDAETFALTLNTLNMGNAGMSSLDDIARALDKMQREGFSGTGGRVRDDNGNTVGKWELT